MSTVVVQARVGFVSAVARVAAIERLHRLPKEGQLESWNPNLFFLKRKPEFSTGQPDAALPRERSDSPAVCPAQVAFSWLDRKRTACCECGGNGGANP
jgi:hypothetical protein